MKSAAIAICVEAAVTMSSGVAMIMRFVLGSYNAIIVKWQRQEEEQVQETRAEAEESNRNTLGWGKFVLNVRGNDKNTAWFGDSGATLHVCAPQHRHLLHDVAKLDTPRVVQGFGAGNSSATSYIKGSIVIDTPQGRQTITDVHYFPQSAVSLLSLIVLHSKGFDYGTQGKSDLVVSKGRVETLRFRKSGTLYELVGSLVSPDRALITKDVNEWHRRLGYVSLDSMRKLATASLGMPDLSQQDLGNCDVCAAANLHRQPFNSARFKKICLIQSVLT
ncbi:hypothetical protein Ae201684P_008041 [Aphanomyces euteiches]|nr:hypothetical protein Ae201684P_008041 [Aphanomyces euteiches]